MIKSIVTEPAAAATRALGPEQRKLKKSCQEFESFFTAHLMKSMRESITRSDEPDHARELYEGMFDETLAKELSKGRGFGLSDVLYESLAPLVKDASRREGTSPGSNTIEQQREPEPEATPSLPDKV